MPPSSNSTDHSQSPHPLSGLPFGRARRSHQAIQSPTDLVTTIDTPLAPQMSGASDFFSSTTFDTMIPYHLLGAIESMQDNATLPERFYKVRCLLEQQPQAPVRAAETNSYEADHGDYFSLTARNIRLVKPRRNLTFAPLRTTDMHKNGMPFIGGVMGRHR